MAQTEVLLTIDYHTDDETGTYQIGEVDFGIHGILDKYLELYGRKGKDEIIQILAHLIYSVECKFRDTIMDCEGQGGEKSDTNM